MQILIWGDENETKNKYLHYCFYSVNISDYFLSKYRFRYTAGIPDWTVGAGYPGYRTDNRGQYRPHDSLSLFAERSGRKCGFVL